jgi:hypothetical protein
VCGECIILFLRKLCSKIQRSVHRNSDAAFRLYFYATQTLSIAAERCQAFSVGSGIAVGAAGNAVELRNPAIAAIPGGMRALARV